MPTFRFPAGTAQFLIDVRAPGWTFAGAETSIQAPTDGQTDLMTAASPNRALDLVLSPAPPPARASGIALAVLRILAGLMWLAQVWWK
jgi:hypothetical protein